MSRMYGCRGERKEEEEKKRKRRDLYLACSQTGQVAGLLVCFIPLATRA